MSMRFFSTKNRPFHLGPYPLERLKRSDTLPDLTQVPPSDPLQFSKLETPHSLVNAMGEYQAMMDAIREVGPGGQFLTSMDTMKKCRSHSWNPRVGVRGYINPGKALEQYYKNIDNTLKQMLEDYTKPDIDANIKNELDTFMKDQGVSSQILSSVNDLINNDLINNNMEKI